MLQRQQRPGDQRTENLGLLEQLTWKGTQGTTTLPGGLKAKGEGEHPGKGAEGERDGALQELTECSQCAGGKGCSVWPGAHRTLGILLAAGKYNLGFPNTGLTDWRHKM